MAWMRSGRAYLREEGGAWREALRGRPGRGPGRGKILSGSLEHRQGEGGTKREAVGGGRG